MLYCIGGNDDKFRDCLSRGCVPLVALFVVLCPALKAGQSETRGEENDRAKGDRPMDELSQVSEWSL
jgi:invasion protein IalB